MALPTRVLSICSGVGGLDLGFKLACPGAVTRLYVENEATAARGLVARIKDGTLDDAPIWSDIKTLDGKPWRGQIDALIGGYPCQPFSIAGKQRGAEDPRHLWPHVARIIRQVEPAAVFLENVENHLRIGYEQVRGELRGLGYQVEEGIFSAEEVGAPHLRKRLFVLAYREERGCGILRESPGSSGFADRRGAELADAGDGLVPLTRRRPEGRAGTGPAGALFPPGPADLGAWRELLRREPTLEPALCGSAPGVSSRVDRLRALGNSVLPLVAGFAFRSLARAHAARRSELRLAA